eukprot:gnl/MRDRNA2_/MRDRNA2_39370_c0_seq1.p1 gnl/MRDRNA2_/MRDRNA2_39370_c0~~gnl/MRDRNA2_/MRDRNA2_39370_c0_seq1.p1  ORF type:complete len:301 (-),score=52.40 gnl/MRDRNA2_/MRDRNA2_39370_c0_seq1:50-952(-)
MGAYESIHNDLDCPVEVWWQMEGGWIPLRGAENYRLLLPESELPDDPLAHKTTNRLPQNLTHQVCVSYEYYELDSFEDDTSDTAPQMASFCKTEVSPGIEGALKNVEVSDIISKGIPRTESEKEDARKMEEAMLQSVREYRNQTKNQTTPDVMLQLEEYLRTLSIHETPPPQQMPTVSIPPMIDPRSLHPQPPQIRHISQVTQVQQTTEPPPIQEPTPAPLRIKQSSQPAQAGRQQRRQSHKVSQDALGRSTQFLLLDLRSNHIEYVVPGLLATIGFMLAVVGLRNFRCLQSVAGDMVSP